MKYLSTAIPGSITVFFLLIFSTANAQYVSPNIEKEKEKYNSRKALEQPCNLLNTLVNKAYTFFSNDMGEFITSENTDIANGVSNKVNYYKSTLSRWPGSSDTEIAKDQILKNGIIRLETDKLYIYFPYYSDVLTAEKEHRKIYDQINGCTINLSSGNVYTLVTDYKQRMIDFNQLFSEEKIDIVLEFTTNKDGMFYNYLVISRRK